MNTSPVPPGASNIHSNPSPTHNHAAGLAYLTPDGEQTIPTSRPINYTLVSTVFSDRDHVARSQRSHRIFEQKDSNLFGDDRKAEEARPVSRRKRDNTTARLFNVDKQPKPLALKSIMVKRQLSTQENLFGVKPLVANPARPWDADTREHLWGEQKPSPPPTRKVSTGENLFGKATEDVAIKAAKRKSNNKKDSHNYLFGHYSENRDVVAPSAPRKSSDGSHDKLFGESAKSVAPPSDETGGSHGRLFGNPPQYPGANKDEGAPADPAPSRSRPSRRLEPRKLIASHDTLFGKPPESRAKKTGDCSFNKVFGPVAELSSAAAKGAVSVRGGGATEPKADTPTTSKPTPAQIIAGKSAGDQPESTSKVPDSERSMSPRARQQWAIHGKDSTTTLWNKLGVESLALKHSAVGSEVSLIGEHPRVHQVIKQNSKDTK